MVNQPTPAYRRRALLSSIGVGATASFAGCLGGDDSEPDDENGNGDDANGDADENGDDDAEFEQAADFPDERECAVCSMVAGEYPDWNAQLIHEDGHREYFCSSGCLAAYYGAPEEFGGPDSEIEGVWVTDYETGELIDGTEAYFVEVTAEDHVDDIMMRNPTPFADREDAEAFVDEFEEYDDDDIITLESFDRELGEFYRGRFFDDDGDDGHDNGHNHSLHAA
ncbi:nitrous oxide reductase accessory protein NosL [Natronorubrum sp. A-ect3]|uniref:nitrous oxide reductase accessory protein NosL n=1 Tax=Natronorubrum sp. A-ect3 TaxID=3242698 RepID=UPI00359E1B42